MNETWPGMANANSCVYVPNCLKGNLPEKQGEKGEREREQSTETQSDCLRVCRPYLQWAKKTSEVVEQSRRERT